MVSVWRCYVQTSGNFTAWSGSGNTTYRFLKIIQHGQDPEMLYTGFWELYSMVRIWKCHVQVSGNFKVTWN